MRSILRLGVILTLLTAWTAPVAVAQQNASVTGQVTDAEDGQPLAGANVVVIRIGASTYPLGGAADGNGEYMIDDLQPGAYTLEVRFVGFATYRQDVDLAAGEQETINVALTPGNVSLDNVIISASQQVEKVLDAPASVSVLESEEIQQQNAGISSSAVLRNTVGVDMATTGVDRQEIVLRGFNNAFSGATYVLTDYRQSAVPSLGVNVFSIMPNASLDLERIEVVRGPGSALYGAGVDAGVIHFITKDPFSYPGTSVSVAGGERSAFAGELRHAGVINENFGYKVTGSYGRADDWELSPSDPHDQQWITLEGPRNSDYEKINGNLTLQYRFRPGVFLTANGGYSRLQAAVLSGIGTVQAEGFGYTYGQLRLQAGNFFAQTYVNRNEAGDSFVYGSGQAVVDNSIQWVGQAQYNLGAWGGRQQFVFGTDLEVTNPNTDGTIIGRNEDETIQEYGAYLQSATQLTNQLDLTLAGRADYNNIVEAVRFSPRAALVYKITPEHSARVSYNHAISSPGTNSLFLDIIAGTIPGTGINVRGRGAAFGYTFERDPTFEAIAGTDLVASSLNPAALGADTPAGLPLAPTYQVIYDELKNIPDDILAQLLSQQLQRPITADHVRFFKAELDPSQTTVQGFSRGQMRLVNPATREVTPISTLPDVEPLKETTSQTVELGYKGLFADRVMFAVDVYYTNKRNFVGPLAVETPFVFVPTLAPDLTSSLAGGIAGNAELKAALDQFALTPEQVADLIVAMAQQNDQFPDKPGVEDDLPVAIVQPIENNPGLGQTPELLLSYRSYGQLEYYGADIAAQVAVTDRLDVFGNLSWVSDDFFDNEEIDEEGTDLAVALNAPTMKAKAGFWYNIPRGFSFSASGRYTEGFPVRSGPYVGDVESYFLLDLGAGYDLDRYVPGLRFDVTVQNMLDNMHREFIGAPEIGRLALLRLTYTTR